MNTRVQAKVTHRFEASAERVFDACLDPGKVRQWLARSLVEMGLPGTLTTVEIDARVGGTFEFADLRAGVEARHWGTYLNLDRPRTLAFTWITEEGQDESSSIVTVSIARAGGGCVVELVHDMPAEWKEYVQRTEDGWSRILAAIGTLPSR